MADGSGWNQNSDEDRRSVSPFDAEGSPTGVLNVLIAEDNPADVRLIREALAETGLKHQIRIARDGEVAATYFDTADRDPAVHCPNLLILDLNLPKMRGPEVLEHLRQCKRCRDLVIIIVSTSDSALEKSQMTMLGANAYFRKPSSYDEFMKLGPLVRSHFPQT